MSIFILGAALILTGFGVLTSGKGVGIVSNSVSVSVSMSSVSVSSLYVFAESSLDEAAGDISCLCVFLPFLILLTRGDTDLSGDCS